MMALNNFLTAEWRKLILLNYIVDPEILRPYLPAHTQIDLFRNQCYVSLVGFMFLNTKVLGFSIPYHINFPEVNLRFYVKFEDPSGLRRGVVFIKEIVPRRAITFIANKLYGENYETMPMEHLWLTSTEILEVSYRWKKLGWNEISVVAKNAPHEISDGSQEDFITNHYWGYTRMSEFESSEYEVIHPVWKVYPIERYFCNVDFGTVYGKEFSFLKNTDPASVFLAEGSDISVKKGRGIHEDGH
jgi:uncharacterized protein